MTKEKTIDDLISDTKARFSEYAEKLKGYHSSCEDLKGKNSALTEEKYRLGAELKNSNNNYTLLQKEYDSLHKNYPDLEKKYNAIKNKYTALENSHKKTVEEKKSLEDKNVIHTQKWQELGELYNSIHLLEKSGRPSLFKNKILTASLSTVVTGMVASVITVFGVINYTSPIYQLKNINDYTPLLYGDYGCLIKPDLCSVPNNPVSTPTSQQASSTDNNAYLLQKNKQPEESLAEADPKYKACLSQQDKPHDGYVECQQDLNNKIGEVKKLNGIIRSCQRKKHAEKTTEKPAEKK